LVVLWALHTSSSILFSYIANAIIKRSQAGGERKYVIEHRLPANNIENGTKLSIVNFLINFQAKIIINIGNNIPKFHQPNNNSL
jgi:hypothetical protein